jgi:predicted O-methyltransferase YrrM
MVILITMLKKYLYALCHLSPSALYTLLRRPVVGKELLLRNGYLFRSLNQIGVPTIALNDLLPVNKPIEVRYFAAAEEFTYLHEVIAMCSLVKVRQPKTIFEIGTFHGYATAHFALNTPPGTNIYTLDLPPQIELAKLSEKPGFWRTDMEAVMQRQWFDHIRNLGLERRVTYLLGDSKTFDYSPYAGKMDLVFVDGAHSYDYVKSDSENARSMLSANGIIVWHDYGETGQGVSVNRAVDEFAARYGNAWQIAGTRFAIYSRCNPANRLARMDDIHEN